MRCPDVVELLPWLLNGTLEGSERNEVVSHLVACGSCRGELEETAQILPVVTQHIPSLALAEYACGLPSSELSTERLELHLAVCRSCRREFEQASIQPAIDFEPAARARRTTEPRRFGAFLNRDRPRAGRLLAIAATLVAVTTSGAVIWRHIVRDDTGPQQHSSDVAAASVENRDEKTGSIEKVAILTDGFESGNAVGWSNSRVRERLLDPVDAVGGLVND